MKKVRLVDVANAAGVSQGTVSNVFNNPELVRPALRDRVISTAQSMGYRGPDPAGRALRAGKVGMVGILTSNPLSYFFDDPFGRSFMAGVSEAASSHGSGVSLISTRTGASAEQVIGNALVDSFVVLCAEEGDPFASLASTRGIPLVRVDAPAAGGFSGIVIADRKGAYMAAQHVIALGHKRILGLMTPSAKADDYYCGAAPERAAGYRDAVRDAGLPESALALHETGADRERILEVLKTSLSGGSAVTAVLAMSDRIALEVLDLAVTLGVQVPRDLSVVGFDDVPEAGLARPALTTVRQPGRQKGRTAVELLVSEKTTTVELPVELIVRESSAKREPAG